ncbi:MAG: hypothetical protein IAF38_06610, partial [Bacteroidia bacterium]|nr:hypothetical protein [Bacteroidia bacterium]
KIRFAGNDYTNNAELQIVPKPDVMIRVYMVYKKANESENIPTQKLSAPPARKGFTVVEWGGSIADETSEENSL